MFLSPDHQHKLRACGLTQDTIDRAELHTGSVAEVKETLGYGTGGTGLVIPYRVLDGYARVRIDNPGPDGKRYRSPKGQGNRLYVPPTTLDATILDDPFRPLHVTEGEFKALKATQEGFPCVALPGVWSWRTKFHGSSFPIADLGRVAWRGRTVAVVFDSDLADKPSVAWAEHALCQELRARGAIVHVLRLPAGPRGEKYGLDDYLVAYGPEAFRKLPMQTLQAVEEETAPTFWRVRDLADAYLLRVTAPHHRIALGYVGLDEFVRGVAPGEVLTILGRAGVGKTSFLLNLITHMTAAEALPSLLFSLEQPGLELFERMASLTIGWPGAEIEARAREEDPELLRRLLDVAQRWHHVVVVEKPCVLDQIDGLIEAANASGLWAGPLRLVAIDYLGLIGQRRGVSAYEAVSTVARELKAIAKRHAVALIVLCQVSREGASGGEPVTMTMARESGWIEEAADYLLGLWRPELREGLTKNDREALRGQFKVRILKNRHGRSHRTATLTFEPSTLRIDSNLTVGDGQ